jgi:hypothetical protein
MCIAGMASPRAAEPRQRARACRQAPQIHPRRMHGQEFRRVADAGMRADRSLALALRPQPHILLRDGGVVAIDGDDAHPLAPPFRR